MLALTAPLLAQSRARSEAMPDGGPAIGSTIKNFSLADQAGRKHEWKQLLKKGPVALVCYRSADW